MPSVSQSSKMRIPQRSDSKGSLKWLQRFTAPPAAAINAAIAQAMELSPETRIDWRSPREADDFAEYRDSGFLKQVGLDHLAGELARFWPVRGPQWDGLAVASDGKVILVEAKANLGELTSSCGAGKRSLEKISRALEAAKAAYGARTEADWTTGFYQYANRLAHLHFLRCRQVDAHLVFVYFINATDVVGPSSRAEWVPILDDCHSVLGLRCGVAVPGVHSVYVDVAQPLRAPAG